MLLPEMLFPTASFPQNFIVEAIFIWCVRMSQLSFSYFKRLQTHQQIADSHKLALQDTTNQEITMKTRVVLVPLADY